jgi:hypothetical protein
MQLPNEKKSIDCDGSIYGAMLESYKRVTFGKLQRKPPSAS